EDSTVQLWSISSTGPAVSLFDHFTLRVSDGPIWWLKFHKSVNGFDLGIASQDKTVRILHVNKLDSLFSNPMKLMTEAEKQGGLAIAQGINGEPEVGPIRADQFVPDSLSGGQH